MNDDPDSMNTVATIDLDPADPSRPYRWCADRMVPDVWRNACDPTQINGGWCEGADRYTDLGANVYDTYGETSGPNAFVPSHTNLGIGNRIFMSLLGEASDFPDRFTPISDATALDLLLRVARALSGPVDWTAYGDAMLTAAREIDGSASPGMIEHQLRSYLSKARMWNRPAAIRPAGASLNPSQQDRVAAASTFVRVPGSPGVERTYFGCERLGLACMTEQVNEGELGFDAAVLALGLLPSPQRLFPLRIEDRFSRRAA